MSQTTSAKSKKFIDPIFPPNECSICYDPGSVPEFATKVVKWRRPCQYNKGKGSSVLFLNDACPGDIEQGQLGDCWLLSALAVVAVYPDLLKKLFVSADESTGKYTIRLYNNHKWEEITIDDYIPCGADGLPVFGHCKDSRETWVVLIEKALAKMLGSYQALDGGFLEEGIVYLTGGRPERLYINNWKRKPGKQELHSETLWDKLIRYHKAQIMMGCSISSGKEQADEASGIVAGHAYGIIDIRETKDQKHKLIKLRNPWGTFEWKGNWSDNSRMWTPQYKEELGFQAEDDGEFWISFADFCKAFDKLTTCRIFNDSLLHMPHDNAMAPLTRPEFVLPEASWHRMKIVGEWNDFTAGGCVENHAFTCNPHTKLSVQKAGLFYIIISRDHLDSANVECNYYRSSIGFSLVKGIKPQDDLTSPLLAEEEQRRTPSATTTTTTTWYKFAYPVCGRYNSLEVYLEVGDYILTPHTYYPNRKGKFEVEIYGEHHLFTFEPLYNVIVATSKRPVIRTAPCSPVRSRGTTTTTTITGDDDGAQYDCSLLKNRIDELTTELESARSEIHKLTKANADLTAKINSSSSSSNNNNGNGKKCPTSGSVGYNGYSSVASWSPSSYSFSLTLNRLHGGIGNPSNRPSSAPTWARRRGDASSLDSDHNGKYDEEGIASVKEGEGDGSSRSVTASTTTTTTTRRKLLDDVYPPPFSPYRQPETRKLTAEEQKEVVRRLYSSHMHPPVSADAMRRRFAADKSNQKTLTPAELEQSIARLSKRPEPKPLPTAPVHRLTKEEMKRIEERMYKQQVNHKKQVQKELFEKYVAAKLPKFKKIPEAARAQTVERLYQVPSHHAAANGAAASPKKA